MHTAVAHIDIVTHVPAVSIAATTVNHFGRHQQVAEHTDQSEGI